ncbi:MAG: c-type cytochrome [Planctomycetota bacterium]|nr:c-type cytochrome [Planctomycetota bacterium]
MTHLDNFAFRTLWRAVRGSVSAIALVMIGLMIGQTTVADDPPLGLKPVPVPDDNPQTAEKVALGMQLYFESRLSKDNTVSCASCHAPEKGFSNGERFATGVGGAKGGRSAPSVINSAYYAQQFWDGRAASLEEQALGPIANPIEMALSIEDAVRKLNGIAGYKSQFQKVFGTDVTPDGIAKAIAAYERTVISGNAPFDKFKAGDTSALSEASERGRKLFFGKANCAACHAGSNFSDNSYHNIGIGMDAKTPDVGRVAVSKLGGDTGAFKTPTLREIARTAPYMHDGSLKTLEEVVEHYAKGGIANEWLDEEIFELKLNDQDKADLVTFMKEGLSSPDYPDHKAPELPE